MSEDLSATPTGTLAARLTVLSSILQRSESVCVGYSGGVDSVFLAAFAVRALGRGRVLAVLGRSAAVPEAQRENARACASRFGIPFLEIETAELSDPAYAANPPNRCYFCKTELWRVLSKVAAQRGMATLVDGTNADDASDYRPGLSATREWSVSSPLLDAGLSKQDIREASRALGLPTWDQPSSPCLSSRLPYGLAVTPQRLRQVESAEAALRALGFRGFRVRHHGDAARLEFAGTDLERALELRIAVTTALRVAGFARVLLDVEGYRSGALNEGLRLVPLARSR